MRQSQSLSRLRKLTDKIKEDEKERKQRELERGEIRGLRRAKVHNMFDIFKQSFKNWVRGAGVEKKYSESQFVLLILGLLSRPAGLKRWKPGPLFSAHLISESALTAVNPMAAFDLFY